MPTFVRQPVSSSPPRIVWLALSAALLVGFAIRQFAFTHTESIRYEANQRNAFYWGNRAIHGETGNVGAVSWQTFWRNYGSTFAANDAHPAARINTLDYVPLRLLMAAAWVNYLNVAYAPVTEWRPEFARSFAAFSMVMELAAAVAMFALVGRWLKQTPGSAPDPSPSRFNNRWAIAGAAAALLWLNPASIIDSHVWPHGQTWLLPFYLAAILAMTEQRFFLAGAIFGIGIMVKGQMLMIAPVLILWPLFDRRWTSAIRVVIGMLIGAGVVVFPWCIRGDFAWVRAGFGANGMFSDVLRKGVSLNFPALLEKLWNLGLHQHVVNETIGGFRIQIELRTLLISAYLLLLVCITRGIARQARTRDRRLLVSIAAPWALMFFVLGQMDERYLVWSACISAGAIAVSRRAMIVHIMLSFAGAATMLEFLLVSKPLAAPMLMHMLIALNPVTWLITAIAVATLFFEPVGLSRRFDAINFGRYGLRRIELGGSLNGAAA